MKIILKTLELINFKKLTGKWEFDAVKNTFLGQNGAGKTTNYDAVLWCRHGRDSQDKPGHGKGCFDIKPIVDGVPMSKAEHSVISTYDIDGEAFKIQRTLKEDWAKKRGKVPEIPNGHILEYRIGDGPKIKKREFDAEVEKIFGGQIFKLVSDPSYFAGLPWKERREILTDMTGSGDPEVVIDSIEGLRPLLGSLSLDKKTDLAKQRKTDINADLKTLPARIDEHKRNIAQVAEGVTEKDAQTRVDDATAFVSLCQRKIDDFKEGKNKDTDKELVKVNAELRKSLSAFETKKNEAQIGWDNNGAKIRRINRNLITNNQLLMEKTDEITGLRVKYNKISAKVFKEAESTCSRCGEAIVCQSCEDAGPDLKKKFNLNKSRRLEQIKADGKALVETKKPMQADIDRLNKDKTELEKIKEPKILSEVDNKEIAGLRGKLEKLEESKEAVDTPAEFFDALGDSKEELSKNRQLLSDAKGNEQSKKRVEQLEKQMDTLSKEFDECEKFLYLRGQYDEELAKQTEGPVNKMFDYTRFRMFDKLVNGTIFPCCDIMNKDHKAYETALSAGERRRVELDMIKTFSEHYGVFAPVFIDGAESITKMPELGCQIIELRASIEHKELTQV